MILDLLSTNSGSHLLKREGELRIIGSCLAVEWPNVVREFCRGLCLSACPERDHINMIALKVASILARVDVSRINVLTVDGSPHCLHLHHSVEEAVKISGKELTVEHAVLQRGSVTPISGKAVKLARYLSRVENLLRKCGCGDSDQ
ncbi:MAG: 4Fe-4S ferredoxin [Candidatus Korarchaeota archaeon]|nr:4Fe-4S ferredoxin [Candidatus Korarchaeota archaeon]